MNTKVKAAIFIGSGLVVGFGAGYFIGRRAAYIQAGKDIDAWTAEQDKSIEEWKDNLERETKTGKYSTIESTADAVFPGMNIEDGRRIGFVDPTTGLDDPGYEDGLLTPDIPAGQPEDEQVDVQGLIAKFKSQSVSELQGGVTYPGQDDDDVTTEGDGGTDDDDTPAPTVPGFVTVRDPNGPYVISIDEYMEDDEAFSKVEMTYFEGDNVLVDENNSIVPDVDGVIGKGNLNKWGTGTTDKDQVYIRNERLEIDVELTRDDNTYTRSVLKIIPSDEEERSMRKPLKMREDDGS